MGKKLTFEYIQKEVEKVEGYFLLSKEYKDNRTKLQVKCTKGHIFEISFDDFKRGRRCGFCYTKNKKYTIEKVKQTLSLLNYSLLSTEYINIKTKLDIKCSKGHLYQSSYNDVLAGNKCPICGKRVKYKIEEVLSYVESFGYKLLSETYVNIKTKIVVQCDKGHIYSVSYSDFLNDRRCFECYGHKKYESEYVKEYFSSFGYPLLSEEYKNSHSKLSVICPEGHKYDISFHSFKCGIRCGQCNNLKQEPLCRSIVEKLTGKLFPSSRPLFLKQDGKRIGLELDMYCENDLPLALEYNGEYHYNNPRNKNIDVQLQQARDALKQELCQKYGIFLITIPYYTKDKEAFIITNLRLFWQWFVSRPMLNLLEYKPE